MNVFKNRLEPCPCPDVEHNWTQEQRQDLARRLCSAERYGLTETANILRARLGTCNSRLNADWWRHLP